MQTTETRQPAPGRPEYDDANISAIRNYAARRHSRLAGTSGSRATAFVFSGGGARGALHVGALRALLEHGVYPDLLVGTSTGAWNAAGLARMPTLAGVDALAEAWLGLHPAQILLGRVPRARSPLALQGLLLCAALWRVVRGRPSLYSDEGMRHLLARHFVDATFEDMALPLRIVAADLTHGGRKVFDRGPIVPAVLASSAIPGIFPPVRIGNAYYADGGTVDGCSVETAVELGARRIFVLAIGYDTERDGGDRWSRGSGSSTVRGQRPRRSSPAAAIQRASQVMGNYQIMRALERVPHNVETHVISLSTGDGSGTLNFRNITAWMENAYTTTRAHLHAAVPHRPPNDGRSSRLPYLSA